MSLLTKVTRRRQKRRFRACGRGGRQGRRPLRNRRGGVCKRADRVVRPCGRGMWIPTPVSVLARNDSASRRRDVGDAVPYEGGRTDPRTGVRRGTWAPPYGAQRSCGADRVARRDGISAGTRAVEHQGTHRGRGQRRATAHRGKLWRHDPLNRKKPENRLRVGQVSAKS